MILVIVIHILGNIRFLIFTIYSSINVLLQVFHSNLGELSLIIIGNATISTLAHPELTPAFVQYFPINKTSAY